MKVFIPVQFFASTEVPVTSKKPAEVLGPPAVSKLSMFEDEEEFLQPDVDENDQLRY